MNKNLRNGLIAVAVGVIIWFLPVPAGLKLPAWHLFAIFVATIIGFILQPLPIGAVAFISLGLAGLLGVLKPAEILTGFGNTTMWLIVSAFLFAKGFVKTGLGRRIAYKIMAAIGDSSLKLAYAMALSDLVVSPATPSNTARGGGILYPIVRSLSSAFGSEPGETSRKIGAYLMKSTFQCNTITSAMFLTSVAPNSLVAALALQTSKVSISWGTWALAGVLPGLIALAIAPYVIYKLYPPEITKTPEAKVIANQELEKMGPTTWGEKVVAGTFILALLLWSTSSFTKIDATVSAIVCVGIMLLGQAIEWKDVLEEKGAWDTLVWMGGLISLAGALDKVGFIGWFAKLIGGSLTGFSWEAALGILLLVYMYSHYAFASLSAHVTAMYAAFLAVAVAAGAPPFLAAMSLGVISALFGGLTHYATGPAPIFFGAGYISQGDWWKIGFIVSVINLIIFIGFGSMWWKIAGLW
ncbi:MAG: anion permease [Sporomusaceae bacterium]|nr:anion permease [Sporomusaceae bacterium]